MYGYRKRTLLHKAAQIGDHRICELLIDHGADVNNKDTRKQTPLWVAAEEGHKDICEVLIQNGASVNEKDVTEKTPFWIAARKKHEDVCKILIDHGAGICDEDESGMSHRKVLDDPLMVTPRSSRWLSERGKIFSISQLIKYF